MDYFNFFELKLKGAPGSPIIYYLWGVIMNLIKITYTKINYIIRTYSRTRRLSFFIVENKTKIFCVEIVEDPCQIMQKCCGFVLRFKACKAQ